jgi:hypothetical protein
MASRTARRPERSQPSIPSASAATAVVSEAPTPAHASNGVSADPISGPAASHLFQGGVRLLTWPAQDGLRRELAAEGVLRLLIVDPDASPPRFLDEREDWIRTPFAVDDLETRVADLVRRADCGSERPVLDEAGLLWFRANWVSIPDAQLGALRLLVANLGQVVDHDALADAVAREGSSTIPTAMKSLMRRLSARIEPLGLELVTVRGRGFLLDVPGTCRLHAVT